MTLRDSARVELYAFIHDSIGPRLRDVTIADSMTLRLELSRPLALTQRIDTGIVTLLTTDSTAVPLASVLSQKAADSLAAVRDSMRRAADTTARARRIRGGAPAAPPRAAQQPRTIVPLPGARPDSAADSTTRLPPPNMTSAGAGERADRPPGAPLEPNARYRVRLSDVRGLDGEPATSDRTITVPPRDTTAARDTTARGRAAVRDSAPPAARPAASPPAGTPRSGVPAAAIAGPRAGGRPPAPALIECPPPTLAGACPRWGRCSTTRPSRRCSPNIRARW